jgi:NAD(P)H-nitrite reductase large subunit
MDLDENICLCFHVSLRKVKKFIRLEKPVRASQISQCYGAGTGCGWCRPYLEKLLAESKSTSQQESASGVAELSPQAYADLRKNYVEKGHGNPPQ